MKKFLPLILFLTAAGLAEAGSVQFSTYYPAPFGMYDRLRLVPRAGLQPGDCDEASEAGTFYYESGVGLRLCDEATLTWGSIGGGVWTQSGDNIYPSDTATNPDLKVGIGTTTPLQKLHVAGGDIMIDNATFLRGKDAFGQGWGLVGIIGNTFYVGSPGGPPISFFAGRVAERMDSDNTAGNVGIGTASPNARLSLGTSSQVAKLLLYDGGLTTQGGNGFFAGLGFVDDGTTYITTASDGDINLGRWTAANMENRETWMFLAQSGNVGIGTTTPNNKLQVAGLVNFDDTRFSTLLGKSAGSVNTGNYNSFFGYQAGFSNTTGYQNTASGAGALSDNTTGYGNTASGFLALFSNTTANDNTANGNGALYFNTGAANTASGAGALYANTVGFSNTASGNGSLRDNTTGYQNTASGAGALSDNTTGYNNTAIGSQAFYSNTTGNNNTTIGYAAGDNITTGSRNIIIGSDIDAPSATADNQLSIGNLIFGTGLDGTGTTISTGNVGIGTASPTSKLHVIGKATFTGGVDPPYISFSNESHESIKEFAKTVEEHEKVMQFWNEQTRRMEVYVIDEDKFYTIAGELIE